MSELDFYNITNMKLYRNSVVYPYNNLIITFDKQFTILYEMFLNFQKSFNYRDILELCVSPTDFVRKVPLIVIDNCFQSDVTKLGAVDIRLEFETSEKVPEKTSAKSLILHSN